ncbi:MAG TPA: YtxH domain-containing protein [Phnomibacter sp.]|nr:YtxH domain-containing protein [Phnomibacter sp.]
MNTTSKVLVGALAGLAAGVVVGVLTAPDKGKDTRAKLAKQAGKLKAKWDKIRHRQNGLSNLEDVFSHEVEGLTEEVRQQVLELINKNKGNKMPAPSLS